MKISEKHRTLLVTKGEPIFITLYIKISEIKKKNLTDKCM